MEPVHFDGEVWNLPYDEQFGWGGDDVPSQWRGEGIMIESDRTRRNMWMAGALPCCSYRRIHRRLK